MAVHHGLCLMAGGRVTLFIGSGRYVTVGRINEEVCFKVLDFIPLDETKSRPLASFVPAPVSRLHTHISVWRVPTPEASS